MIGETDLSKRWMLKLTSPTYILLPCDKSPMGLLSQHLMNKVIQYKIEECDSGHLFF